MVDGLLVDGRSAWSRRDLGGTAYAKAQCMKATSLEEVVVYRESIELDDEVSAILQRPIFGRDVNLKNQLDRSSSRIAPLIAEGYAQLTDRHVAAYLGRARGSASETNAHLRKAHSKKYISDDEYQRLSAQYTIIGKRLSRWIHYLEKCDWKRRG